MSIRFNHQFCEGNQAANYLAKMGESGKIELYHNFHELANQIKGIFRTEKLGLPILEGSFFFCFFVFFGLSHEACLDFFVIV